MIMEQSPYSSLQKTGRSRPRRKAPITQRGGCRGMQDAPEIGPPVQVPAGQIGTYVVSAVDGSAQFIPFDTSFTYPLDEQTASEHSEASD